MAYVRSTRVDPRDLQRNTAIGVRLPFNAPGVFYSTFSTKDQLKYNLINLLLTSKGERIYNPEFISKSTNPAAFPITVAASKSSAPLVIEMM